MPHLLARVSRLERDIGPRAEGCPACFSDSMLRRVGPDWTEEQVREACTCAACGRHLGAKVIVIDHWNL